MVEGYQPEPDGDRDRHADGRDQPERRPEFVSKPFKRNHGGRLDRHLRPVRGLGSNAALEIIPGRHYHSLFIWPVRTSAALDGGHIALARGLSPGEPLLLRRLHWQW